MAKLTQLSISRDNAMADVDRQPAQNLALAQQLKDIQQQATVAKAS